VRLDPTRASAWGLIADMLTTLGEQTAADAAMRDYLKAAARPEVLIKAAELVAQGKLRGSGTSLPRLSAAFPG